MPLMHLIPDGEAAYRILIQPQGEPLDTAEALSILRATVRIPKDAVGAMLAHPSFRQQFSDCIIHR